MTEAPDESARRFNRALALQQAGNLSAAADLYRSILARNTDHVDALHHLGLVEHQLGRHALAGELIQRVVRLSPGFAEAHLNLGNAHAATGRLDLALDCYRNAAQLKPDLADAHCNLGLALKLRGEFDAAVVALRRALDLRVAFPEARVNLGATFLAQGRIAEAAEAFQTALELAPRHAGALAGLGNAMQEQGRLQAAVLQYRNAIEADQRYLPARLSLGNALLESGEPQLAVDVLREAVQRAPADAAARSNLLLAMQYLPAVSGVEMLEEARAWERACLPALKPERPRPRARPSGTPLHVGFVSGDLRAHPVGWFLREVLAHFDRRRFALYCYANQVQHDSVTTQIRAQVRHWHDVYALDDAHTARRIEADGIDVLVDLAGHTAGNRLGVFGLRPATVQVSWLGYFSTTGLSTMDWVVMDEVHAPPGSDAMFTEQIARIRPARLCYSAPAYAPEVTPAPCLVNGYVTFGSFNNTAKINHDVLETWADLLAHVPGSRLLLKWKTLNEVALRARIRSVFAAAGVAPGRIAFAGATPHDQMLAEYADVDIALDPFPFTGATTSCEALWMGVPVLTLSGAQPVSRQTAALLIAMGLDELCTNSPADYVTAGQCLARDPQRIAELRMLMRERFKAAGLCDAAAFGKALGDLFARMHAGVSI